MGRAGSHVAHLPARLWIIAGAVALLAGVPGNAHPGDRHHDHDSDRDEGYDYVSPVPGSDLVSPRNNIAFRQGSPIDESSLSSASISVTGAASGPHRGRLVLSDDARTILFLPDEPFAAGEKVAVALQGGIRTRRGGELPRLEFDFTVARVDPRQPWDERLRRAWVDAPPHRDRRGFEPEAEATTAAPVTAADCGSLPFSYPPITLLVSDRPEPGYVFLSPFNRTSAGRLVIIDNLGNPIFYRRLPGPSTDFKIQPDGRLTYYSQSSDAEPAKFYAMDASYAVVDSFATGNGYQSDSHDLQLLPGNHALLLSYDPEPVRMDLVLPGGRADAVVVGLIVQEIDAAKNVVFQWRSWDHFKITDTTSPLAGLLSPMVDYVHGNAIEPDHDGNLLLTSRHLCEITKIDRKTGDVLWRMGPHASRNQFTFVNDDRGFSHQHDVRRLPNGHITVFDNGNLLPTPYSRALEYEVDERAKVATLVWEYRNVSGTYGPFMGNVQRHPSGGTMIGWGAADPNPKLTELHADGTKAYELGMASGTWTYRAFRFPFRATRFTTDVTSIDFGHVRLGHPASRSVTVRNPTSDPITIDCAITTDPAFAVIAPLPASLDRGGSMRVDVRFDPALEQSYAAKLYLRSTGATELIAQDVALAGAGVTNLPPDCGPAHATPSELWPPKHELTPISIEGVTDPDGDPVSIEVTSVTQDEEPRGKRASACPSAVVEDGKVSVRAERNEEGDGRVYRIGFTARDPKGAECEGTVRVCVPDDRAGEEGGDAAGGRAAPRECRESKRVVNALATCPRAGRRDAGEAVAGASLGLSAGPPDGGVVPIVFMLPEDGVCALAVYDLAGRRIAMLERGARSAGQQRVVWNTAGIPAGMYFLRVRAGTVAMSRPILVVR